jgi:hypothetical protein
MKKARCDIQHITRQHAQHKSRGNQRQATLIVDHVHTLRVVSVEDDQRLAESEIEIELKGYGIKWKGRVRDLALHLRCLQPSTTLF